MRKLIKDKPEATVPGDSQLLGVTTDGKIRLFPRASAETVEQGSGVGWVDAERTTQMVFNLGGSVTPVSFIQQASSVTEGIQDFFDYICTNKVVGILDDFYDINQTISPPSSFRLECVTGSGLRFSESGTYSQALDGSGANTGKVVLFDTAGTIGSSISGRLNITTTAIEDMINAIALYPANGSTVSEWTIESLLVQKVMCWTYQPNSTPMVLPVTRWNISFLHVKDCAYPFLFEGVNGLDDVVFSNLRVNNCKNDAQLSVADLNCNNLFLVGGSDYNYTASGNSGENVITLSSGHSLIVNQTIAIVGAGVDGINLVATITNVDINNITLDETLVTTVSGTGVCIAKGGLSLSLQGCILNTLYIEGNFSSHPLSVFRSEVVDIRHVKFGSGPNALGMRKGHPIYIRPQGESGKVASANVKIAIGTDDGISGVGENIKSFAYIASLPTAHVRVEVAGLLNWNDYLTEGITPIVIGPSTGSTTTDGPTEFIYATYSSWEGTKYLDQQTGFILNEGGRRSFDATLPNGTAFAIQSAAQTTQDQIYKVTAFNKAGGTIAGEWRVSTLNGLVLIQQIFATSLTLTNKGLKLLLTNSSGGSIDAAVTIEQSYRTGKLDILIGTGQMDTLGVWTLGADLVMELEGITAAASSSTRAASLDMSPPVQAASYRVTFEVTERSAGTVTPRIGGLSGTSRSAVGVYSEIITIESGASSTVSFLFNSTFVGKVSNLSIVKV